MDGNQQVYSSDYRGRLRVRDAMPRVFSPKGFNLKLPLTLAFESGFTGFLGLERTSLV
jgi:hypothetical protein